MGCANSTLLMEITNLEVTNVILPRVPKESCGRAQNRTFWAILGNFLNFYGTSEPSTAPLTTFRYQPMFLSDLKTSWLSKNHHGVRAFNTFGGKNRLSNHQCNFAKVSKGILWESPKSHFWSHFELNFWTSTAQVSHLRLCWQLSGIDQCFRVS